MFNIIMSSKFFKESTEAELFTVTCCVWIFQSVQTLQSLIKVLEASRGGLIDQFGWLMDADGHFDFVWGWCLADLPPISSSHTGAWFRFFHLHSGSTCAQRLSSKWWRLLTTMALFLCHNPERTTADFKNRKIDLNMYFLDTLPPLTLLL